MPRGQVLAAARSYVAENRAELDTGRYGMLSRVVMAVRAQPDMRWAAPLHVKTAVEDVFLETFGPRDDAAALKAKSKAESRSAKAVARAPAPTASTSSLAEAPNMFEVGWLADVARQGEPKQVEPKRLAEHLERTGGKFFSRFPPEPNGVRERSLQDRADCAVSPHRSLESHRGQLWLRAGPWRSLLPALRRHEPRGRGAGLL